MITERDLQEAIAECQGQRNPNASTCIKLAAFLTIQRELYGFNETPTYSYAEGPVQSIVSYSGDTEFAKIIEGQPQDNVFHVLDELMSILYNVNPKLYNGVISELSK